MSDDLPPSLDRRRQLASTPVVELRDAIVAAERVGLVFNQTHHRGPGGLCYVARSGDAIKIGFSGTPAWRVYKQNLIPVAFILGCNFGIETAFHYAFASELIPLSRREVFRGPKIEAFASILSGLGKSRASDHVFGSSLLRPSERIWPSNQAIQLGK